MVIGIKMGIWIKMGIGLDFGIQIANYILAYIMSVGVAELRRKY